ncbi:hypothetical protein [Butyrivibrio sp. AE3004]|uniref:hypothetical protein n=1 Tax=Butyrivibrio sp. AE3004 TaxID=1506994 RepID=UPI0004948EE1|nr:hypothetical protein [Butyrivibrio sp. AE3004]
MDYDYLSSIVSNYSNLTTLNSLGTGALGSMSGKGISAISGLGNALGLSDDTSAISGASTFSAILDAVMKSGETEEMADAASQKLSSIAGAGTDSAFDGEARSNMILQNYLYTTMMKDSLQNSLTDKADFTSGLFSGLAVGSEDEDSSSILGSLKDTTLGAIGNYSSYKSLMDNALGEEALDTMENVLGSSSKTSGSADSVKDYSEQGSLLREMLSSLSNELRNIPVSVESQEPDRTSDSHLRLRSATYRRA